MRLSGIVHSKVAKGAVDAIANQHKALERVYLQKVDCSKPVLGKVLNFFPASSLLTLSQCGWMGIASLALRRGFISLTIGGFFGP
jgi:hypothetical protein